MAVQEDSPHRTRDTLQAVPLVWSCHPLAHIRTCQGDQADTSEAYTESTLLL